MSQGTVKKTAPIAKIIVIIQVYSTHSNYTLQSDQELQTEQGLQNRF